MNRMRPGTIYRRPSAWALTAAAFVATTGLLIATDRNDPAQAQGLGGHNANAPVDVAADSFELQSRAERASFAGNVVVVQAGLTLRAQRVTVAYTDANQLQINRIDATGGVVVQKGDQRASGGAAIYDIDNRLITLVGNVELTQGPNRMSGGRMVIDMTTGRATVDGRTGAPAADIPTEGLTTTGRRVTGRFNVPQRN